MIFSSASRWSANQVSVSAINICFFSFRISLISGTEEGTVIGFNPCTLKIEKQFSIGEIVELELKVYVVFANGSVLVGGWVAFEVGWLVLPVVVLLVERDAGKEFSLSLEDLSGSFLVQM